MRMSETSRFNLRFAAVAVFTCSAIFWLLFSLAEYPWIVIADAVGSTGASERAAVAGGWLFLLSLLAIAASAGMFGRGSSSAPISLLLLIGWIAATLWLYPTLAVSHTPYRLLFHLV